MDGLQWKTLYIKMDDLGVPLISETSICRWMKWSWITFLTELVQALPFVVYLQLLSIAPFLCLLSSVNHGFQPGRSPKKIHPRKLTWQWKTTIWRCTVYPVKMVICCIDMLVFEGVLPGNSFHRTCKGWFFDLESPFPSRTPFFSFQPLVCSDPTYPCSAVFFDSVAKQNSPGKNQGV